MPLFVSNYLLIVMNNIAENKLTLLASIGVILCLTALVFGAFGAHVFNELLLANQREQVFDLANRYHFYHGLATLALAAIFGHLNSKKSYKIIAILFFLGTLIFSGSLYVLALSNVSWLGVITPIGGLVLIVAWCITLLRLIKGG